MIADKNDKSDFDACIQAVVHASVFMDANDADALVQLFTENLEFVRPSTDPNVAISDITISGRAALHAVISERDRRMVSRHIATNIVPRRISANVIEVKSYFTHFRSWRDTGSDMAIPIEDTLRSMGEYEDRFVHTEQRWLIARRVGRFLFGGL